jgi:hypothetical protein
MPRRGLHVIKEPGLLGTLRRERGLLVEEGEEDHSGPGISGESSREVQTSQDVIMGDTCFGANNDDDVMDVSSVEAEAGSVVLDSSDESIGKVPVYGVIWPSNNNR